MLWGAVEFDQNSPLVIVNLVVRIPELFGVARKPRSNASPIAYGLLTTVVHFIVVCRAKPSEKVEEVEDPLGHKT